MIAGYEATIASLRAEIERSQDALQQLVDYIKDGCPDDGRYYVMTEAQAALKGIKVVQPASPLRGREEIARIILVEVLDFKKPERAGEHCQKLANNAAAKILGESL